MTVESVSVKTRISWILNIIFQQALVVITVFIIATTAVNGDVSELGTWHQILTPLGMVLVMMEGLISFSPDNVYLLGLPRPKRQVLHSFFHWLSTILITIGIVFRIKAKSDSHFTTTHGILGLLAWIFSWISICLGITTSKATNLRNYIPPVWLKLCHNIIGFVGFTFGIISLCYGLKNYLVFSSHEDTILAVIVTTAILYAWSLVNAVRSAYSHILSILGK